MGTLKPETVAFTEPHRLAPIDLSRSAFLRAGQWKLLVALLVLADLVALGLSFRIAYLVRFELGIPLFKLDVTPSLGYYVNLVIGLTPLWLLVFALNGLYNRQNLLGGTQEYALVFNSTVIGILVVIIVGFLGTGLVIARGWLVSAWFFTFLITSAGRFIIRRLIYRLRRYGFFLAPTLIVGANQEGRVLAEQLSDWEHSGLHVLGFVDEGLVAGASADHGLMALGGLDELDTVVNQHKIEEIVLATSAISRERMLAVFKRYGLSSKVNVRMSSGVFELITTGVQVKEFASVPLVKVNRVRLTGVDEALKALVDYGLAIPLLIVLAPLMLIIALAVRLDSPGPIIHRRRVMGVNGEQFDAFKFRTMVVDGERLLAASPALQAELAEKHKLKHDPRITRLGRFLRKYSLDELPQLFNILRHEMSLVGPRMISPEEMEKYRHWGTNLLTIRPGITGLWQVSGRSDTTYEERVRMDMYYIRNWTVWLDLQIILATVPALIKARGAY